MSKLLKAGILQCVVIAAFVYCKHCFSHFLFHFAQTQRVECSLSCVSVFHHVRLFTLLVLIRLSLKSDLIWCVQFFPTRAHTPAVLAASRLDPSITALLNITYFSF